MKFSITFVALALATTCTSAAPDLARMRAIHMTGNWAGNVQGIKPSPFASAQSISASTVQVTVNRSSFVNSAGVTQTNDVAQVKLTGIKLGTSSYAKGGFWILREVSTGAIVLQFRPSLDTTLAGFSGFSGDPAFSLSAGNVNTSSLSLVSGAARDFVIAVLTQGATLVQAGTFTLQGGATLDKAAALQAIQAIQTAVQTAQSAYFQFLKSENVEWIGISVAIFYDSIADPTVKVRYRPAGDTSFQIFTFDDADLRDFIARARQEGFRIYLTLAFEPSDLRPSSSDLLCRTPQHKYDRSLLGVPVLANGDIYATCINPADWWWSPAHPSHATNLAQFWNSYTQVAVKYGSLAQQLGVDLYSLGTETDNLFRTRPGKSRYTNHFQPQLAAMVAAIRAVYSGLLTFDQFSKVLVHPEFYDGGAGSANLFTDLGLDVVGISAYFALAGAPVTTVLSVAQLEALWDAIFQQYLVPLQAVNPGKRVVFTEFGYTDDVGSPASPNSNAGAAVPAADASGVTGGMQQQQNIHQAFFNVNQRYSNLVAGVFIWGNDAFTNNPQLCSTVGWGLYCKSLAQTVSAAYANWLRQDADRLFAWAEVRYPQLFPEGPTTQTAFGYMFRYYPGTGNYLGIKDNKIVVHNGKNWNLLEVGAMRTFLDTAAGEGF